MRAQPSVGTLPLTMLRNHDGARRRDPQTYHRDAQVLEAALASETDPFLVSRYTFYLAQSYRDCGEQEKARQYYLARAELGFWDQEVFVALLQAARLAEALEHPDQAVLDAYQRATEALPTRAEALHDASRFCRTRERFAEGCRLAERGLRIPVPGDGLFVESWIYAYGLPDELAVNAYWAERFEVCLAACDRLLRDEPVPQTMHGRIEQNRRFAIGRLAAEPSRPPAAFPALRCAVVTPY